MYHVIVNPVSGRGRAKRAFEVLKGLLEQHHCDYQTHTTKTAGHAQTITQTLPEDATILAVGGDGTLHEIATKCVHTKRTLGIIPVGSGDDFAYALDIPRKHVTEAFEIVKQGNIRLVDTGKVNGETFINSLGIGFDAEVAHNVFHAPKFLKDQSAYFYAILRTLSRVRCPEVEVWVDDKQVYGGASLLVGVQNGKRTGGSYLYAPEAELDDGLLNIVVGTDLSAVGIIRILPRLLKGTHHNHPKVRCFQGKNIQLQWEEKRLAHMEGELLEASQDFEVRLEPKSLRVFAP